ncbi:MAG TPA: AraC family transcriptional regulator ligand-binding domain-containing protein [Pyrinomonadaceae bacterium]|nr:AraC family transcriptional regulator ligand-binding domain-containing protein [Pyrinomonadaceae bacterium]
MAEPTIAAGYPKAFLDFAAARGADRHALLARSHIRPGDLEEQDDRVPLSNYLALMEAGVELCQEPALALLFGEASRLQDISVVGLIGEAAETTEEARRQINRYARLMLDEDAGKLSDHLELVRGGGRVWLKYTSSLYADNRLLTESAVARNVCGAREHFGATRDFSKWPYPKAIHFTHQEPSYRAEYDRVFGVPLVFGSHMNAMLMDEEFLSVRMPRANRYVFGVLSAHAEALLRSLESSKTTRGRVESLLMPVLHTGEASMDVIAGKLGLSRQTLFRRLKAEGATFEKVLDELRHRLALHYLGGKKVSVNETAYLVGFSDPAAFSRAFKRWTGSCPRAVRASEAGYDRTASARPPGLR